MRVMDWMQGNVPIARFFPHAICALLLAACSKAPSGEAPRAVLATPTPEPIVAAIPATEPAREETVAPEPEPAPAPEQPVNASALERRFFSAQNDPAARIAVVQELADVPPAIALTMLNRLFPVERREDVKMEMLTMLGDLDHEKDRDNQLALCTKALAPRQPARVRYVAVNLLADLGDPRGRALLISLIKDNDRKVRAAAIQVLRDLRDD